MSERARERIRQAIAGHGPIPFAEFMELALYGPGGFYEDPPVGERGHFVTSPHVHPVFGQLVARGLREMSDALGRPTPFHVVEVGAGDGTLARRLIESLRDMPLRYTAVERSAGGRRMLGELGVRAAPSMEVIDQGLAGCIVANELLDNLPFHRVRGTESGVVEVHVDTQGDRFVEVDIPCGDEFLGEAQVPGLRPGEEAAVSLEALRLVDRMVRLLRTGYALLVDYGWEPGAPRGGIHGYRGHRVIEDVLADPGSTDITAGVNLAPITGRAEALGWQAFPPVSQRASLHALGYTEWAAAELGRQAQLQDRRSGREAVDVWSGRNAARLLVDPQALGRLRWLVLATPGLPTPPWLSEAIRIEAEHVAGAPVAAGGPLESAKGWARASGPRRRPRRRRSP
jgi:SAM-dependent MidA family methyltransferase